MGSVAAPPRCFTCVRWAPPPPSRGVQAILANHVIGGIAIPISKGLETVNGKTLYTLIDL